ncbi:hypothetical protein [Nocardioides sp. W7]|uniref:hypothetical protein n=1 Tax=Nocardioides sp. W7 TaxID=2931390 RepID=UPI001FD1DDBB|nr:hypothetical protein [Nocardioides sp. W7]
MSTVRTRVWGDRQAAAAGVVIAVMVVWRAVLVRGSYFNQDDFYLSARGARADLTWGYLFEPFAGHVIPAQQLNYWLVGHFTPFRWDVVAIEIVTLQLLATVVTWHLLTRLLPGRWARVPLLAVFAWSPLTLMPTLWWAAALALWPQVLFSLLAMLFLVRARQGAGRAWINQLAVVLCLVAGLTWHSRAVLIVPVLLGLSVALADEAQGWRRLVAALRRFWLLWGALVTGLVAFLVVREQVSPVEGGTSSVREALAITWQYLGRNVVPGLVGGPWAGDVRGGAVSPSLWVTVVSMAVVLAGLGLVLWRGGPARRWAVFLLVGYVIADLVLLISGRGGFGSVIALDPRYAADVVHVGVVAVAVGLRGTPPGLGLSALRGRRRLVAVGAVAALGTAYVLGTAFGTALLVPHFQNTEDRAYVAAFRADLAVDPNQVMLDALVPPELVLPLIGDDARLSRVFASLPESPAFDEPSARMRTVMEDGRLVAFELAGSIPAEPGPEEDCGYSVHTAPVRVPFVVGIRGQLVARVGYFTDREHVVEVGTDSWTHTFLAHPGPNRIWVPVPDVGRELDELTFRVQDSGSAVCIVAVEAGLPEQP